MTDLRMALGLVLTGSIVLAVGAVAGIARLRQRRHQRILLNSVSHFVDHDASPSFITDGQGEIMYRNKAAGHRFEDHPADTLAHAFDDLFV
ncbi:MAG: hybrid sensor histidine kinase/response regulator, partial [Paracoccaceae bacterium]|nr:hybrid sensor histidine kinase/response regulator [Paracoccaceae bacterium]